MMFRKGGCAMQRKQGSRRSSHAPRLVLLLLFALVLAVAGGLFSCAFQPMMAARGTMLFLPGV
ncbi:hypothetical protein [Faecalibacterium prausnitzii]|uniref:hypothetical protein n=1 Tax=Faecalibacterium prausnitzii TaxID=853 RepID=UPI00117B3CE0|nr:hypothetical protein [Faecalibacterium prausnitzii]